MARTNTVDRQICPSLDLQCRNGVQCNLRYGRTQFSANVAQRHLRQRLARAMHRGVVTEKVKVGTTLWLAITVWMLLGNLFRTIVAAAVTVPIDESDSSAVAADLDAAFKSQGIPLRFDPFFGCNRTGWGIRFAESTNTPPLSQRSQHPPLRRGHNGPQCYRSSQSRGSDTVAVTL